MPPNGYEQRALFQTCSYPDVLSEPRAPHPIDGDEDLWALFHEMDPRAACKVEPDPNTGCWVWLAACDYSTGGYGRLSRGNEGLIAHRYVYQMLVGPIADGLVLDHLCRRPPCVRPTHLEPVTVLTNTLRAVRAPSNAPCRTIAGYQQHFRRGEPPCPGCRSAWRAYQRTRPRRHR